MSSMGNADQISSILKTKKKVTNRFNRRTNKTTHDVKDFQQLASHIFFLENFFSRWTITKHENDGRNDYFFTLTLNFYLFYRNGDQKRNSFRTFQWFCHLSRCINFDFNRNLFNDHQQNKFDSIELFNVDNFVFPGVFRTKATFLVGIFLHAEFSFPAVFNELIKKISHLSRNVNEEENEKCWWHRALESISSDFSLNFSDKQN